MVVARPSQPALQLHNRGSIAIAALITVSAVSVWVVGIRVVGRWVIERKTEVIENNDFVETIEATKSIIPIKVPVVEMVETAKPIVPIEVPVVETAKPIIPIEVPVVETAKAGGGV